MKKHLALLFLLAGCATGSGYRYRPTTPAYNEPAGNPTGSVRASAPGVSTLRNQTTGATFPAVHVRLAVSVQKDAPAWSYDASAQEAAFPNAGSKPAIVAGTDAKTLTIAPGELRTVDLYFPLPDAEETPSEFDLHWQLLAGNVTVKETTSFQRARMRPRPDPDDYPYGPGFFDEGPYWYGGAGMRVRVH